MTDIRAPEGGILAAVHATATGIHMPESGTLVAFNIPAKNVAGTEAGIAVTFRKTAVIAVAEAGILAVVRGRAANPVLRCWTFSLDGHDFYVLRLGDLLTLVYDLYSDSWMTWADLLSLTWRAQCGVNWDGAQALAEGYGSNVIVGDDNYGLLWFLDPTQPFDDNPDELATPQQIFFDRAIMGQVPVVGREVMPCYAAWLTTDMGNPGYVGAGVMLYGSDDGGVTFDDYGLVTVTPDENSPELSWYSLGQISAPGRLFKIVDDGAVARIDSMEMNDPAKEDDDGG